MKSLAENQMQTPFRRLSRAVETSLKYLDGTISLDQMIPLLSNQQP